MNGDLRDGMVREFVLLADPRRVFQAETIAAAAIAVSRHGAGRKTDPVTTPGGGSSPSP